MATSWIARAVQARVRHTSTREDGSGLSFELVVLTLLVERVSQMRATPTSAERRLSTSSAVMFIAVKSQPHWWMPGSWHASSVSRMGQAHKVCSIYRLPLSQQSISSKRRDEVIRRHSAAFMRYSVHKAPDHRQQCPVTARDSTENVLSSVTPLPSFHSPSRSRDRCRGSQRRLISKSSRCCRVYLCRATHQRSRPRQSLMDMTHRTGGPRPVNTSHHRSHCHPLHYHLATIDLHRQHHSQLQ